MTGPKRFWFDALEKVRNEDRCRVCGRSDSKLDCAHISGRVYDKPREEGRKTLWVNPDDVVPLCGPFPSGCHGEVDSHKRDLLPFLSAHEQARAVLLLGSIESARRKLAPSLYRDLDLGGTDGE